MDATIPPKLPDGAEEHLMLWHYTDLDSLVGIHRSCGFFATDIRYLNDGREYTHALSSIMAGVRHLVMEAATQDPNHSFAEQDRSFFKALEAMVGLHVHAAQGGPGGDDRANPVPYVVSFSSKKNDLSQWRAYGGVSRRLGTGVAIGIPKNALEEACRAREATLQSVIYVDPASGLAKGDDTYNEKIRAIAESLLDKDRRESRFDDGRLDYQGANDAIAHASHILRKSPEVLALRAQVKDIAFHDESEYRVIHVHLPRPAAIKFRTGAITLRPYFLLRLWSDDSSPVTEIELGPSPAPELATQAIRMAWPGVLVTASKTPYRDV